MKKFVLLLAAIMCMQTIVLAIPDTAITGPYKISFDLGIPKEAYKVEIIEPKTKESLSGDISTTYNVNLINKTGLVRRAAIIITSYDTEQIIPLQDELVKIEKYVLVQTDNMYDVTAAGRKIDGYDGAVASGTLQTSGLKLDTFAAMYYPTSTMSIAVISSYPWEDGTLSLLKTIHIEKNTTG
jgi:hypothetical protein